MDVINMKNINQNSILTILAVPSFLILSTAVGAQSVAGLGEIRPLFANHDTLAVRIEAPMTTLMKKQPDEEYLEGTFSYTDSAGQEHSFDLKVQTRGRYRRQKSTCNFSPLRLNFPKGQVEGTEFDGQDKLKLVTHCQTNKKNFEQYVLREYLAYRIMQTLTDNSFGARLMQITYVNTEKNGDSMTKYGFVIEDEDDIGIRLGLTPADVHGIKSAELDPVPANIASVYEYLIGNTDFSLILGPEGTSCCHNAILFSAGGAPYIPIPYDFDFSGIVDAPYAEPNPRFKIRSVTDRVYRGRCWNNELLDSTFAYFLEKEAEIRNLLAELEGLDDKNRSEVSKFLDEFFADISDPSVKEKKFIKDCA
jgi:hypothetical protein